MTPKEYQIKVLGHRPDEFTEYRSINGGEFVGINPRKTKDGRTAQDVSRISCIVVDIDNDTPQSDLKAQAQWIVQEGHYHSFVIVSSGRGLHLYIPVDLQKGSDVKGYIKNLAGKWPFEGSHVDISVSDDARVIRVWGSKNEKNGAECKIIEDHFNGINTFKLPVFKESPKFTTNLGQNLIQNGNRNATLAKLAGIMRNKGFEQSAIEAALLEENKLKCNPPLPELEVKAIARSISRYIPQPVNTTKSLITHSEQYLNSLLNRKQGYSTGFLKLDEMLAGLQKSRLYVLAARTNEGKTSFVCNIVSNLLTNGISVLYFPTELGYEPLYDKVISRRTNIPLKSFQFGTFTPEQQGIIEREIKGLSDQNFKVHENFSLTLHAIQERTKEISPQIVVIDFIQAMKYIEGSPAEIASNVRGIKELSEQLSIPIILCSQLNRSAINNEISLSQLKGSGSIEEFADVVMALSTVSKFEYPRVVDLYVLKNRYSEIGKVRFNFYSQIGKFEEKEIK